MGWNRRIRNFWIVPMLFIFLFLPNFNVNGRPSTLSINTYESTHVMASEGDIWEINLESNGSVNILIIESNEYLGSFRDNRDSVHITRQILSVTSGKWNWKQTTDDLYYLIFENADNHEILLEWNVKIAHQSESIPIIGYLLLSIVIIDIIIGYFIITYPIYWKKKK